MSLGFKKEIELGSINLSVVNLYLIKPWMMGTKESKENKKISREKGKNLQQYMLTGDK